MDWLGQCDAEAKALPQETRQKFLDLIRQGKTLGDAREKAGVSFNAANGILRMNMESVMTLRKESK